MAQLKSCSKYLSIQIAVLAYTDDIETTCDIFNLVEKVLRRFTDDASIIGF